MTERHHIITTAFVTLASAAFVVAPSACSGGSDFGQAGGSVATVLVPLTQAEVEQIVAQAVTQEVALGVDVTVAVNDREGDVLAVFAMTASTADDDDAISAAGTAAYFASNQNAFTTRTAEFIIQDHFPPTTPRTPGGPLFGVQFSNRVATDELGGALLTTDGNPIARDALANAVGEGITGLTVDGGGGGVPLFKNGAAAGGVGVAGVGVGSDDLERIAIAGSTGFAVPTSISGLQIVIDGIRLPFTDAEPIGDGATLAFAALPGANVAGFAPRASPMPAVFPIATLGGVTGELRFPIIDSPLADLVKLDAAEVTAIVAAGAQRSARTRAAIRRPLGTAMQCFIVVVDRGGNVLAAFRTPDATLFSFDVAIQKARTAAFFSDDDHGYTTRALGFIAQGLYPPGIDGTSAGALHGLQAALTIAAETAGGALANGITVFPGGVPLYESGVLVGAIGVSGDGVDQDDIVADSGTNAGFAASTRVRCDFLDETESIAGLDAALLRLDTLTADIVVCAQIAACRLRLADGLAGLRLPWVKHPREPDR
ncbi:MAG: heme-binding protein [Planctomycetes bacterium]|nr:heme-binding protein [Planctomycetota bacterium]